MNHQILVSSSSFLGGLISQSAKSLDTSQQATITAINFAIPQAMTLAQILKHRIKGLYQQNQFQQTDSYKTLVKITLSLTPLDSSHKGYQAPIPQQEVDQKDLKDLINPPSQSQSRRKTPYTPRNQQSRQIRPQQKQHLRRGFRGGRFIRGIQGRRGRDFNRFGRRQQEIPTTGRRVTRGRPATRRGVGNQRQGEESKSELSYRQKTNPELQKYVFSPEPSEREPKDILVGFKLPPIVYAKEGLLKLKQENLTTLVVKGSGQMIPKAIRVAQEIKKYEIGLHQMNFFLNRTVESRYVPTEEGLEQIVRQRKLIGVQITLSKEVLDNTQPGYQYPIPDEQWHIESFHNIEKGWIVQEEQQERLKNVQELQRIMKEQRYQQDIQKVQVEAGIIPSQYLQKMNQMYEREAIKNTSSLEYLLGKSAEVISQVGTPQWRPTLCKQTTADPANQLFTKILVCYYEVRTQKKLSFDGKSAQSKTDIKR